MMKIKCFLCGKETEIKTDKRGNLYYKCVDYDCGAMLFVYGEKGMERLIKIAEEQEQKGVIEP